MQTSMAGVLLHLSFRDVKIMKYPYQMKRGISQSLTCVHYQKPEFKKVEKRFTEVILGSIEVYRSKEVFKN